MSFSSNDTFSCDASHRRESEFTIYSICRVALEVDFGLKLTVIILALLSFGLEIILLIRNRSYLHKKPLEIRALIVWLLLHGPLMALRPILSLGLDLYSSTSIGLQILTHLGGASAACSIILFINIELNLLFKGSIRKVNLEKSPFYQHKRVILITMSIAAFLIFMVGPLLRSMTEIPLHILFWSAVIFTNVEVIPFFGYLGLSLQFQIAKLQNSKYDRLSRHIKIMIIICAGLGLSAGGAAIYLIIDPRIEWIVLELTWIADVLFSLFLYSVIVRRSEKKMVPSSGKTSSKTNSKTSSKESISSDVKCEMPKLSSIEQLREN